MTLSARTNLSAFRQTSIGFTMNLLQNGVRRCRNRGRMSVGDANPPDGTDPYVPSAEQSMDATNSAGVEATAQRVFAPASANGGNGSSHEVTETCEPV